MSRGSRTICCHGDSITFGEHVDPSLRWTNLLQGANPDYTFLNSGHCADTSRLGLERFPHDVQKHLPHAVLIQFGINDANQWETDGGRPRVSEEGYQANLAEMIDRAFTFAAAHVFVFVLGVTPTFPKPLIQEGHDLDSAGARYHDLASEVASCKGVPFIDLRHPFSILSDTRWLHTDGVHLSSEGHHTYAARVARSLEMLDG